MAERRLISGVNPPLKILWVKKYRRDFGRQSLIGKTAAWLHPRSNLSVNLRTLPFQPFFYLVLIARTPCVMLLTQPSVRGRGRNLLLTLISCCSGFARGYLNCKPKHRFPYTFIHIYSYTKLCVRMDLSRILKLLCH